MSFDKEAQIEESTNKIFEVEPRMVNPRKGDDLFYTSQLYKTRYPEIKFIINKESVYKADLEKVVNLKETVFLVGEQSSQKTIIKNFDVF
jgi:hypothetical protein